MLENLEKIREAAEGRVDARFRLAITAFRNALSSDEAAIELYFNCMEKVDFEDVHKRAADFREWKRQQGEKLSDPGLRLALRYQLRWLMLTLEAASVKPDRARLVREAQETVDSIFRDSEKLKYQQQILSQSVTSTVFARAYDINHVKVEKWSLSPIAIDAIYDNMLLPPYRTPTGLASLRAGWIKRIQQETVKQEFWSAEPRRRGEEREEKRIAMADDMKTPEYLEFIENELPQLQWDMEVDLFTYGDESGASVRMLAHLEKYINHPSAREWGEEFKKLIQPKSALTPEGVPAAPGADAAPAPGTTPDPAGTVAK
ncbi:hypothetical protein GCM10023212_39440 [Luteolibacter yonseiensis]